MTMQRCSFGPSASGRLAATALALIVGTALSCAGRDTETGGEAPRTPEAAAAPAPSESASGQPRADARPPARDSADPAATRTATELRIPVFQPDDPSLSQAGLVERVRLATTEADESGRSFSLIAFGVSDQLTLNATVRTPDGATPFRGRARFAIGEASITVELEEPFETGFVGCSVDPPAGATRGGNAIARAATAGGGTFRWVEVLIPRSVWFEPHTTLVLAFEDADGNPVARLPAEGRYDVRFVPAD